MDTTNTLLAAILGALILIGWLLVYVARRQGRRVDLTFDPQLTAELKKVIDEIGQAARHHADVSAVVELVRQLDADPDALELIKSYPETVRAAAWLHYINQLGVALQAAQVKLQKAHDGELDALYSYSHREAVTDQQQRVDNLRTKLDAAITASSCQPGLRSI